ncbi:MAG TPA: uroporphyrinogen decarboxylase family protein [Phycisphaerae bacterium]|nr:uroporphyrinogen decarboxylase family protein [Phycisphaerae bacterium]
MTGRKKIEEAMSPGGTRAVPAVICYEGIYVRDHWDALTDCPWWYQSSPDVEQQLAWRRDVIGRTEQDWFALPACPSRAERAATVIEQRADGVYRVWGHRQEKLQRPVIGGWDPHGVSRQISLDHLPESLGQVDASIPSVDPFDSERFTSEGRGDLAAALLGEFGNKLYPIAHVSSPLWHCYSLWGFEGMMVLIAERPDLVRRACERLLGYAVRSVRQAAALGAAGIWVEECLTDMISPAAFEAINVPVLGRLIGKIRKCGMKSIYYYCGDPAGKWESILSLGMDALSLEESKKGFTIELADVVRRVGGRCAVLGNLDAVGVLQNGSDRQLRDQIERQIRIGKSNGNRFIMSLGSPVTPSTPVERVARYGRLVRQLG